MNGMGDFLAALRKAKGMTQQEVADALGVSNKTVSKWERGDSYPDILLIPVLADLFDVTSDEILRGGRIPESQRAPDVGPDLRALRQAEHLLKTRMNRFGSAVILSGGLLLAGVVLLCVLHAYGYGPAGAGVFALFGIAAGVLHLIHWSHLRRALTEGSQLLELSELRRRIGRRAAQYSFFLWSFLAFVLCLLIAVASRIGFSGNLSANPFLLVFFPFSCLWTGLFIAFFYIPDFAAHSLYPGLRHFLLWMNLAAGTGILATGAAYGLSMGANIQAPLFSYALFAVFVAAVAGLLGYGIFTAVRNPRLRVAAATTLLRNLFYAGSAFFFCSAITVVRWSMPVYLMGSHHSEFLISPGPMLISLVLLLAGHVANLYLRRHIWQKA